MFEDDIMQDIAQFKVAGLVCGFETPIHIDLVPILTNKVGSCRTWGISV